MAKGIREKSADTSILENRLRHTNHGDVVTYDELSQVIGRDVGQFCLGNLHTARNTLRGEKIHFDVVRGTGLVRLNGDEAVAVSRSYVRRASNAAKSGMKLLQNVEFEELSTEGKKAHLATSAQLGVMTLFGSSKATKKLEDKVNSSAKQLAIGETLKLFGG